MYVTLQPKGGEDDGEDFSCNNIFKILNNG